MRIKLFIRLTLLFFLAIFLTSCSESGTNFTFRVKHDRSFACVPPELALLSRVSGETTRLPFIPPVCTVKKVHVRVGQWVYRGEVVAELSSPFIDRAIQVQQSQVEVEKARLRELEEKKEKLSSFPLAGAQIEKIEKVIDIQKEVVELSEEALKLLMTTKDSLIIKSSATGLVIDAAREGEVLAAGQPVVVLERSSGKIYAFVPESNGELLKDQTLDFPEAGRICFTIKPGADFVSGEYVFDDFRAIRGVELFARVPSLPFKDAEVFDIYVRKEGIR